MTESLDDAHEPSDEQVEAAFSGAEDWRDHRVGARPDGHTGPGDLADDSDDLWLGDPDDPELMLAVSDLRAAFCAPVDEVVAQDHLEMLWSLAPPPRSRRRSIFAAAAAVVVLLTATAGLASASALPAPLQNAVSAALQPLGIDVPRAEQEPSTPPTTGPTDEPTTTPSAPPTAPPGQGDAPPGPPITPPGQGDTPPGPPITPPGQGGTPPGQGDTPPGPPITPPGQGGTPPGQGGR